MSSKLENISEREIRKLVRQYIKGDYISNDDLRNLINKALNHPEIQRNLKNREYRARFYRSLAASSIIHILLSSALYFFLPKERNHSMSHSSLVFELEETREENKSNNSLDSLLSAYSQLAYNSETNEFMFKGSEYNSKDGLLNNKESHADNSIDSRNIPMIDLNSVKKKIIEIKKDRKPKVNFQEVLSKNPFPYLDHPIITNSQKFIEGLPHGFYYFGSAITTALPPLLLSDKEMQKIIDQAYTQENYFEKYKKFIIPYIEDYHPNEGRLPELIHMYTYQNDKYIYAYDGVVGRINNGLDFALQGENFFNYSRNFIQRYPSTRVSTELLFQTETNATANLGDLIVLLTAKNYENNQKLDKNITKLQDYYTNKFGLKLIGITDEEITNKINIQITDELIDGVIEEYDQLRLSYMEHVRKYSPDNYRVGDSWFRSGLIKFKRYKSEEAIELWKQGKPNEEDTYKNTYAQILNVIDSNIGWSRINKIGQILDEYNIQRNYFIAKRSMKLGYKNMIIAK